MERVCNEQKIAALLKADSSIGSGGWIPTQLRATCGAFLREGSHGLLIDAGTGISRLLEAPHLIEVLDRLDLVLTHFHLDHVVGLGFIPALGLPAPPTIQGPGQALYDTKTATILSRLLAHPFLASDAGVASEVREIGVGETALGAFGLRTRVQLLHSNPTLGLRINDEIAYCTDTYYDVGNIALAEGCGLLVHEAWYTARAPQNTETHASAAEAAQVARAAGVRKLILIHLNPRVDEAALLLEATGVFADTAIGTDLMPLVYQGAL